MSPDTKTILERVASWPEEDQRELAEIAAEIEAARKGGVYRLSDEERAAVRKGLEAARIGDFASDEDIGAFYNLHRRG
jgi:hypothetical protein